MFNNLVNPPTFIRPATASPAQGHATVEEERALLREEALEETAVLPADLGTSGYDVVPERSHAAPVGETR